MEKSKGAKRELVRRCNSPPEPLPGSLQPLAPPGFLRATPQSPPPRPLLRLSPRKLAARHPGIMGVEREEGEEAVLSQVAMPSPPLSLGGTEKWSLPPPPSPPPRGHRVFLVSTPGAC